MQRMLFRMLEVIVGFLVMCLPRDVNGNPSSTDNGFSRLSYTSWQTLQTSFTFLNTPQSQSNSKEDSTTTMSYDSVSLPSPPAIPSTASYLRYMQPWMTESILSKLLTREQIQHLANHRSRQREEEVMPWTLQSVYIAGVSPSFAAALRHLFRKQVSNFLGSAEHKVRRQTSDDGQANVVNVQRDDNSSVVTLNFFLKLGSSLVAVETALKNLQKLSTEEMAALLDVPVISPPVKMIVGIVITPSSVEMTSHPTTSVKPPWEKTPNRSARAAGPLFDDESWTRLTETTSSSGELSPLGASFVASWYDSVSEPAQNVGPSLTAHLTEHILQHSEPLTVECAESSSRTRVLSTHSPQFTEESSSEWGTTSLAVSDPVSRTLKNSLQESGFITVGESSTADEVSRLVSTSFSSSEGLSTSSFEPVSWSEISPTLLSTSLIAPIPTSSSTSEIIPSLFEVSSAVSTTGHPENGAGEMSAIFPRDLVSDFIASTAVTFSTETVFSDIAQTLEISENDSSSIFQSFLDSSAISSGRSDLDNRQVQDSSLEVAGSLILSSFPLLFSSFDPVPFLSNSLSTSVIEKGSESQAMSISSEIASSLSTFATSGQWVPSKLKNADITSSHFSALNMSPGDDIRMTSNDEMSAVPVTLQSSEQVLVHSSVIHSAAIPPSLSHKMGSQKSLESVFDNSQTDNFYISSSFTVKSTPSLQESASKRQTSSSLQQETAPSFSSASPNSSVRLITRGPEDNLSFQTFTSSEPSEEVLGATSQSSFLQSSSVESIPKSAAAVAVLSSAAATDTNPSFMDQISIVKVSDIQSVAVTDSNPSFVDQISIVKVPDIQSVTVTDSNPSFVDQISIVTVPSLQSVALTDSNPSFMDQVSIVVVPNIQSEVMSDFKPASSTDAAPFREHAVNYPLQPSPSVSTSSRHSPAVSTSSRHSPAVPRTLADVAVASSSFESAGGHNIPALSVLSLDGSLPSSSMGLYFTSSVPGTVECCTEMASGFEISLQNSSSSRAFTSDWHPQTSTTSLKASTSVPERLSSALTLQAIPLSDFSGLATSRPSDIITGSSERQRNDDLLERSSEHSSSFQIGLEDSQTFVTDPLPTSTSSQHQLHYFRSLDTSPSEDSFSSGPSTTQLAIQAVTSTTPAWIDEPSLSGSFLHNSESDQSSTFQSSLPRLGSGEDPRLSASLLTSSATVSLPVVGLRSSDKVLAPFSVTASQDAFSFSTPPLSDVVDVTLATMLVSSPMDEHMVVSSSAENASPPVQQPTSSFTLDEPPLPPASFLRMKIRVKPDVDVTSSGFLQHMRAALQRLYLAALAAVTKSTSKPERRRKRQVDEGVQAQVLNLARSSQSNDQVLLDFKIAQDGQQVPEDNALATLKTLSTSQMSNIITFPVLNLTKEIFVNKTLTVTYPNHTDMVIITSGVIIMATKRSLSVESSEQLSTPPLSLAATTSSFDEILPSSPPFLTSLSPASTSTASSSSFFFTTTSLLFPSLISPSPTATATILPSSVPPTPDPLSDALMRIDLQLKPELDEQGAEFKESIEQGLVLAYQQAEQSRRKRHVLNYDISMQGRHDRHVRQTESQIEAEVTNVARNSSDPRIVNVTFYVMENGTPVPADTATLTLNKLSANELSAILAYPVVSEVRPVTRQLRTSQTEFDNDDDGVLFVVAIVLPCILVLLLALILIGFLVRSCREAPPTSDPSDVVSTKYQRGESLDDYNLHVDVERGEIVDRTPRNTPNPATFRRDSKTPLHSSPGEQEETLDSKRLMIDKWLQKELKQYPQNCSTDSVDSVAKSDTCLYAVHYMQKEKKKSRYLEVPKETYKTQYLQALKMPVTAFTEEESKPESSGERRESFALEERSFDEDNNKPLSPAARDAPTAKPRSFVKKLRDSMRRRKRSLSPEYNTQSTVVSALGDSSRNLSDGSASHDTSVDGDGAPARDEEPPTQHADASDEFTMIVPTSHSPHASKERLESSSPEVAAAVSGRSEEPSAERPERNISTLGPTDAQALHASVSRKSDDHSAEIDSYAPKETETNWAQQELSSEGYFPSYCTTQTQTSLASSNDDSREDDVTTVQMRSVAVGSNSVNRRTQTQAPVKQRLRLTKPPRKTAVKSASRPQLSSSGSEPSRSGSEPTRSGTASMEDEQEEKFGPGKVEAFAKMSRIFPNPVEQESAIPVKFRQNIFEDEPGIQHGSDAVAISQEPKMSHPPGRHLRAQPRVPYRDMETEERTEAERLDTAVARQQLLLRQQQEVMAYAHRQQVEQQAQHIINKSFATGNVSAEQQSEPVAARQVLKKLLNEACVLTAPNTGVQPFLRGVWTPSHPVLNNQGYYNPVTVLTNHVPPMTAGPPPGAPGGFMMMGQDELLKAVRKELRRLQQE